MADYEIIPGSTGQTLQVFVHDATSGSGAGLTGLAHDTSSLTCYYSRAGSAAVQLSLVAQTVDGVHVDGGFVEVDTVHLPGVYRLDLADAVIAVGVTGVTIMLAGAANMVPVLLDIQLGSAFTLSVGAGATYCTLAQLRARLGLGSTDTASDTILSYVLEGVSREIDRYCGRFFYQTASGQIRYYTGQTQDWLETDDIVSVSDLSTDVTLSRTYTWQWLVTDYDLEPYNAPLEPEPAPYTSIRITPRSTKIFWPGENKAVRVTGVFGWPAVPSVVREAVLLQSIRLFKRKDAPFGVAGSAEMGQMIVIPKLDPDLQLLVDGLKKSTARTTIHWNMTDRNY